MTFAELYPWLKALHVAAALAFTGGVLTVSVFLAAVPPDTATATEIARSIRRWDQSVTTVAMLAVWVLGLTLATGSHAFAAAWLQAKLLFVLILSGLHGMQSGRLRRLARGASLQRSRNAPLVVLCAVAIALLAVAKPI